MPGVSFMRATAVVLVGVFLLAICGCAANESRGMSKTFVPDTDMNVYGAGSVY
jgi:hypothetical protein